MAVYDFIDWFCDECGVYMNNQSGFNTDSGAWTCAECGADNDVTFSNVIFSDNCDDDDDIPEGCDACGGPYPHCTSSCSMFD